MDTGKELYTAIFQEFVGAWDLPRLTADEIDELQVAIDAQRARGVRVKGRQNSGE